MDLRIVWTAPALEDLEALVRYIAQDDTSAAVRVGDKIVDHVGVLASFPGDWTSLSAQDYSRRSPDHLPLFPDLLSN